MQLLADENVPCPIIDRLRADGWTVPFVGDLAPGEDDDLIILRARGEGLVLLTQDRDFGELVVVRAMPIDRVVLFELERLTLAAQVERLSAALAAEKDRLRGHFTVVEPARVWRRML